MKQELTVCVTKLLLTDSEQSGVSCLGVYTKRFKI